MIKATNDILFILFYYSITMFSFPFWEWSIFFLNCGGENHLPKHNIYNRRHKLIDSPPFPKGNPQLWHWVVSTTAPWVAGEDALEGEPATFEEAIFLNRLDAVVGTGGYVAAALSNEWRQRHLINPNQEDQELGGKLGNAFHGWRATYFLINSLTALRVFSNTSS